MSKLDTLMVSINKTYKEPIIQIGTAYVFKEKVPMCSPRLNYILYGGLPVGKAIEFIGPEGSGKTTTAIDAVAGFQQRAYDLWQQRIAQLVNKSDAIKGESASAKKEKIALENEIEAVTDAGPRRVVFVDAENTLDEDWAKLNGVDLDSLYLVRPQSQTAEQVLQMMLDILDTGEVEFMVLDSIPMLVSQKLFEKTLDAKAYGGIADVLAQFASKVPAKLTRYKSTLLMLNQIREDLDNPYNIWHTPGGRAVRHLYSLRLGFKRDTFLDADYNELPNNAQTPVAHRVAVHVVKTKVSKPDRRLGYYTLNYTEGIDVLFDTIEVAVQVGALHKAGSWYYLLDRETGEVRKDENGDDMKYQGRNKLSIFLKENLPIYEELYTAVNNAVAG